MVLTVALGALQQPGRVAHPLQPPCLHMRNRLFHVTILAPCGYATAQTAVKATQLALSAWLNCNAPQVWSIGRCRRSDRLAHQVCQLPQCAARLTWQTAPQKHCHFQERLQAQEQIPATNITHTTQINHQLAVRPLFNIGLREYLARHTASCSGIIVWHCLST